MIDGLLAFGTETPENLAAAAQLDVAAEEDDFGRSDLGLCLKDYAVRLDHVLWLADGADIPEQVQERWPGLPQQEWDCALRVAKLVLSALGSPPIHDSEAAPRPAQAEFRAALWAIGEQPHTPPEELGDKVTAALLAFASATPDNLTAAEHLGVSVQEGQISWDIGLCLLRPGIRLSHLLASAVGSTMPPTLLEDLPELIQEDWDTVLTVTALVLSALESDQLETAPN
ncbi:hypothetical protein [Kitasatospora sp. GP30]|uniref:hypothetical protein n=1 Tax=Kitasatospora sp. GP30 TaxID=3035084 RepID=UPI000C70DD8B|nr:hypothetical protein [Kitasatospora sp. GP30]